MYQKFIDCLNNKHPNLIRQIKISCIPEERRKFFTFGNFLDCNGQGYIYIVEDFPRPQLNDDKIAALFHEYGHYICRMKIYPNLWIGRFFLQKLRDRKMDSYPLSWPYVTRLINVSDELFAWLVGYFYLFSFRELKIKHFKYGFKCWKKYWRRIKRR